MGAYTCSVAVLTVIFITPINGIITLSIPDGESDSFVWTADRDHPNKRIGDDPRAAIAFVSGAIIVGDEITAHDVPHFATSPSETALHGHVTIRGPP